MTPNKLFNLKGDENMSDKQDKHKTQNITTIIKNADQVSASNLPHPQTPDPTKKLTDI